MKHVNKHILEAIQRGIQLALDDYDEQNNGPVIYKTEPIKNNNSTKELIDFYNSFVDLGLPSGTLWRKYNVGAKDETEFGYAYQWAEIMEYNAKKAAGYNEYHNKYYDDKNYKILRYCGVENEGNKDDLNELLLVDDAAYQYDNRLKTPSKEQFDELLKYTKPQQWPRIIEKNKPCGVYLVSKINGNRIFLRIKDPDVWSYSCYWSSSRYTLDQFNTFAAWALLIKISSDLVGVYKLGRTDYHFIRPVLNKNNEDI